MPSERNYSRDREYCFNRVDVRHQTATYWHMPCAMRCHQHTVAPLKMPNIHTSAQWAVKLRHRPTAKRIHSVVCGHREKIRNSFDSCIELTWMFLFVVVFFYFFFQIFDCEKIVIFLFRTHTLHTLFSQFHATVTGAHQKHNWIFIRIHCLHTPCWAGVCVSAHADKANRQIFFFSSLRNLYGSNFNCDRNIFDSENFLFRFCFVTWGEWRFSNKAFRYVGTTGAYIYRDAFCVIHNECFDRDSLDVCTRSLTDFRLYMCERTNVMRDTYAFNVACQCDWQRSVFVCECGERATSHETFSILLLIWHLPCTRQACRYIAITPLALYAMLFINIAS